LKTTYVAPATSIETDLAKIWAEVLSLEPVGMDDNFFDLGGNSLTAMRVASGVLKHFQLEIPLQALFDSPTIAQMAKAVEKNLGNRMTEPKLERLINEIERMPEEEAQRLLALRAPSQS
jgi:acyl carrier protein